MNVLKANVCSAQIQGPTVRPCSVLIYVSLVREQEENRKRVCRCMGLCWDGTVGRGRPLSKQDTFIIELFWHSPKTEVTVKDWKKETGPTLLIAKQRVSNFLLHSVRSTS